jgi:hypothetical protein
MSLLEIMVNFSEPLMPLLKIIASLRALNELLRVMGKSMSILLVCETEGWATMHSLDGSNTKVRCVSLLLHLTLR